MWYKNNEVVPEWELDNILENYYNNKADFESYVDAMLDEIYPSYTIGGVCFSPSRIVKELDRTLYNQIYSEELDNRIDEDMYELNRMVLDDGDTLEDAIGIPINDVVWREEEISLEGTKC